MKSVAFDGKTFEFPDDASDAEIKTALGGDKQPDQAKDYGALGAVFLAKGIPAGAKVSPEDRKWLLEAMPGDQGYNKHMDELYAKYGSENAVNPLGVLMAGILAAGVPAMTAASAAPIIPITAMGRNMAAGTTPVAIEPGLAAMLKVVADAAGKGKDAVAAAAANPAVREAAKWLGRGALGAAGYDAVRRVAKGGG